jgi:uncharacterized membrane protein
MMTMTFAGRFHPLLVHFPIGLVLIAAVAEVIAIVTDIEDWRVVAVANLRAGALFAGAAVVSGWFLAVSTVVDDASSLGWHRWIGTIAAVVTLGAALATGNAERRSRAVRWRYQFALFGAAALVAVTGHLGGRLVWGADFLHP